MKKKRQVLIMTNFTRWDEGYSLCYVVRNQVKMLRYGGYDVTVAVCSSFSPGDIQKLGEPQIWTLDAMPVHDQWRDKGALLADSQRLFDCLSQCLSCFDIVITHDLIYQPDAMKWNIAIRQYAKFHPRRPKWLHWIHSATPLSALVDDMEHLSMASEPVQNSWLVFPNDTDLERVRKRFGFPRDRCWCVWHAVDLEEHYGFVSDDALRIAKASGLLYLDVVGLLPVRLDRGKQIEFAIEIFAEIIREGRGAVLIVIDFHSRGDEKRAYRDQLVHLGQEIGSNVLFTSVLNMDTVSRETILALMRAANVFILPSRSESYSLVTQEAALSRTILVLNASYPPMKELWGPCAIYADFGSNINADTLEDGSTNVEYTDRRMFCKSVATTILHRLDSEPVLRQEMEVRRARGLTGVWESQLRPLIEAALHE